MLPHVRKPGPLAGVVKFVAVSCLGIAPCMAAEPPERGKAPIAPAQVTPPTAVISVPSSNLPPAAPGGARVVVRTLQIKGNTRFLASLLLAKTGWVANQELDLAGLQQLALNIQDYYHQQGFFLTRAYLPPQHNTEGNVTIEVLEAHYGKVVVTNPQRLAAWQVAYLTAGLKAGDTPQLPPLESAILRLNDVPGLAVKSTIAPGASTGLADLTLVVGEGKNWSGNVYFDINGSRATGRERLGAGVVGSNLGGWGDQLSLRALSSFQGLNNGRIAYQVPLNAVTLGVAYSITDYSLGREFANLRANGTAKDLTVSVSSALKRSRQSNLYLQITADDKKLRDRVDSTNSATDKSNTLLAVGVNGDRYDDIAGRGLNTFNLNWSSGNLRIDSLAARQQDAASVRTAGHFNKITYGVSRLHSLSASTSLSASFNGQWADKNLDSSEKMVLGGPAGVRAYGQDDGSGDIGNLITLELRHNLPENKAIPGIIQLSGFLDYGQSQANKEILDTRRRSYSGIGLGVQWLRASDFSLKLDIAFKLGSEKSADDRNGRIWLQGAKYF
ncbi:MAG: hypothetical protein RL748_3251 [Pseudomonadota bacterium]